MLRCGSLLYLTPQMRNQMSKAQNKCNSFLPTISFIGVMILSSSVLVRNVTDGISQLACKFSGVTNTVRPLLAHVISVVSGNAVPAYHQNLWVAGMAGIVGVTHSNTVSVEELLQIYAKTLNLYPASSARLMVVSEQGNGEDICLNGFTILVQTLNLKQQAPAFQAAKLSQVSPLVDFPCRNNTYIEGSAHD